MLLNQCFDFSEYQNCKIALVSDSHAEISDDVLELVAQCDIAIHAGDICSMQVLEQLQPKTKHIIAVAGNNDVPYLWDVKDWHVVKSLPDVQNIKFYGGTISLEHGHLHDPHKPSHDSLRDAHKSSRIVVYGHTHHQVIDDEYEECIVINPGASGKTRTHGGPSCVVLSINNEQWKTEAYRFDEME